MARRKIVISMMMHEIDTFSPVPTPLASCRPLEGEEAVQELEDTNTQLGGFLHVAPEIGVEVMPSRPTSPSSSRPSSICSSTSRRPKRWA